MGYLLALIMATIVNTNLAGFTVTYNTVQFGGADSTYKSEPPMYGFSGRNRYDESGRAVIGVEYRLEVRCLFFETSEVLMAANMRSIRQLLAAPGALLKIEGLGTGFGSIAAGGTDFDIGNGPRPMGVQCVPIGQLCWELSWAVEFFVSECASGGGDALAWMAFNFNTTWRNDFEGLTQRIITGHLIIPQFRNSAAPKTVLHVAEETRGSIIIDVPPNFARLENLWRESDDKQRLDFSIIDEQIGGDFLPAGITEGDGACGFSAGDGKGGFADGLVTLSMSLKTAPNQPRNLAGQIFLAAALSKQGEMSAALSAGATIIPLKINIVAGKFRRARQTDCMMAWHITSCLNSMLSGVGIWTPVSPNDYTLWKASMTSLWGNRGFSGIGSVASEAVIIDLCDNVTTKTIGVVGSSPNSPAAASPPSLTCPEISEDGGWLQFDLEVRVLRKDEQTQHRRAASYVPTVGAISGSDPLLGTTVALGGPTYSQSASEQHVTEYHGFPETYIGLKFKGLRFKNKPYTPEIVSIAGMATRPVKQDPGTPKWAFDVFGCPVWFVSGWRIYSVPGYVSESEVMGSKTSCSSPTVPTEL